MQQINPKSSPGRAKIPLHPRNIMVEPTNMCNASCPTCPSGIGQLNRPLGMMTEELYSKIVNECSQYGTSITLWNFGEPFLHPKIYEFIEEAATAGISVKVSTNGTAFYSERRVDRLLSSGVHTVIVGIEGITEETHTKFRKRVNFNAMYKGLKYYKNQISESGLPFKLIIQMLAMDHNMHEIGEVQNLAKNLNASFELKTMNLEMVSGINYDDWLPEKEELRRYTRDPQSRKWVLKSQMGQHCANIEDGFAGFVINWDGKVIPCCNDYQSTTIIGDLQHETIHDIWNGEKLNGLRQAIRTDSMNLPLCTKCSMSMKKRPIEIPAIQ